MASDPVRRAVVAAGPTARLPRASSKGLRLDRKANPAVARLPQGVPPAEAIRPPVKNRDELARISGIHFRGTRRLHAMQPTPAAVA